MTDKSRVLADAGWAWAPSHFARAAPWLPWRGGSRGVCANPQGSTWHCRHPSKSRGTITEEAGPGTSSADGAAGRGPAGSCPRQPGAPAWACGLGSGILCGPSQRFPEKAGGLGEERAPSCPPTLQLGSLCACFLQRCRSRGRVASSPESISQVTLVSHKWSGQEGPSDSTWSG